MSGQFHKKQMSAEQNKVMLPIIHLPGGLHVIVGGFVEIDDHDQDAVVLTYTGGGTRTLTPAQSEDFLTQIGLRQPPATRGVFGRR
jgi:hypothetical protein